MSFLDLAFGFFRGVMPDERPRVPEEQQVPSNQVLSINIKVPTGETEASMTFRTEGVRPTIDGIMIKLEVTSSHAPIHTILNVSSATSAGVRRIEADGTEIAGSMFLENTTVVVVLEDEMTFTVKLPEAQEQDVNVLLKMGEPQMVFTRRTRSNGLGKGSIPERMILL